MATIITLKSFCGNVINDASFRSIMPDSRSSAPAANAVFLEQASADSQYAGMFTVAAGVVTVRILPLGNTRDALAEKLRRWMARGTYGALVGTFSDDGLDYGINCVVTSTPRPDPDYLGWWIVQMQTGDTDWVASNYDTDTWAVTGTGGTKVITVSGTKSTRLHATFTATVLPTLGYLYQNMYQLINVPGVNYGTIQWCLTINHAALVTAGKAQTDADDVRVWVGTKEVKRWIDGPNTTTCKVWFNVNLRAGAALTLKTAVTAIESITTLQFNVTDTNKRYLAALPKKGIIQRSTEWMAYSRIDVVKCQMTISERATLSTTAVAHAANAVFYFIQNPIYLVYGNSSATAPALDNSKYDDTKPLFDLNASDNTKGVWTASTLFAQASKPNRTAAWKFTQTKLGTVSECYPITGNAETGNPALGVEAGSYLYGSTWRADSYVLSWQFRWPGGIRRFSSTGRKYRSKTSWFNVAAIRRSSDGTKFYNIATEATPASLATWAAALAQTNTVIDDTTKILQFYVSGQISLASAYALLEALTVTVDYTTANIPSGTFLGETSNYPLDFRVKNTTPTATPYIDLGFQMRLNKPFVVDSEQSLVTYGGVNAFQALSLDDESREIFLPLEVGSNTLQISGVDCGSITVALKWKRRRT